MWNYKRINIPWTILFKCGKAWNNPIKRRYFWNNVSRSIQLLALIEYTLRRTRKGIIVIRAICTFRRIRCIRKFTAWTLQASYIITKITCFEGVTTRSTPDTIVDRYHSCFFLGIFSWRTLQTFSLSKTDGFLVCVDRTVLTWYQFTNGKVLAYRARVCTTSW